jgi:hypothetical protein
MSETQFTVEEIERDGEKMLRIDVIDTSDTIRTVTNSTILTQNLEAYIGSEKIENTDSGIKDFPFPLDSDITPGDIVLDLNPPEWVDNGLMRVKSTSNQIAKEWFIDANTTVADKNPEYSENSHVICCKPSKDSDIYAYPRDRLELTDYEQIPEVQ